MSPFLPSFSQMKATFFSNLIKLMGGFFTFFWLAEALIFWGNFEARNFKIPIFFSLLALNKITATLVADWCVRNHCKARDEMVALT